MMTEIEIKPFQTPCNGSVRVPGSKSISNRALLLSCFNRSTTTHLRGILKSEDVEIMINALRSLGINITEDWSQNYLQVEACGGVSPVKHQNIKVGNAGTVARFLTAWLAVQEDASFIIDGSEEMRKRPIGPLLESFIEAGIVVDYAGDQGFFPIKIETQKCTKTDWQVDASQSSQMLSALMMISPLISLSSKISFLNGTVSRPFLEITRKMIQDFSGDQSFQCNLKEKEINIRAKYSRAGRFDYEIEPDATAASYFLTLPQVVGGKCELIGIHEKMLQGDAGFQDILKQMGADINKGERGISSKNEKQKTLSGGIFDFNDISDTFLTIAAVSPLLSEKIRIKGIAHTRVQECDRVHAMATELEKMGQGIEQTEDSLLISPDLAKLKILAKKGISVDTYNDHRVAMSFAILGSYNLLGQGKPWLKINNPMCCGKTFPAFFDKLEELRRNSY